MDEHELLRVLEVLRQFDVRILRQAPKRSKKKQTVAEFYQQFSLNLANFKFNRDEANER